MYNIISVRPYVGIQYILRSDTDLIKSLKKFIAGVSAILIMVSATGCGSSTKWAMQYGDYEARAGIFLYYEMSNYYEATQKLKEADENFDATDTKALKTATVEDTPIVEWIQNGTTEDVETYLEVLKEFDEYGLSLTDDEEASVDTLTDTYWQYYSEYYTKNGIGEQSFRDINAYSYKWQKLFEYYYGKDGLEEVPEQDIKDYYIENNARVSYISLNCKDADGNFMSTEMKSLAEDYVKRANAGESFDDLIEEYNAYAEKVEAENSAETTTESTGTISSEAVSSANEEDTTATTTADEDTTIGDSTSDDGVETTSADTEETPYPNEHIVTKATSEDSGAPTVTVNKKIFAHEKLNEAFLVEEDNAYYVVIKYDITERMTADDLWTDDTIATTLTTMKKDDFNQTMLSKVDTSLVVKNEKAYSRYNPLDMQIG